MSETVLDIQDVRMAFGNFEALSGVSLSVPRAASLALVGPNGAGKTTLINCVSGLHPLKSGRINFLRTRIDTLRPHKICTLGIARTFQGVEQFRRLTAVELVMAGLHQSFRSSWMEHALQFPRARREENDAREIALATLERLDIVRYANQRLETLSYGIRKLTDLARALCSKPKLLMLDEPSAGIGLVEKERLRRILRELRGDYFETLVVVDHDMNFVEGVCEDTVVLNFGRTLATGKTAQVLRDPEVIEAYLGLPVREDN